MTIQVDATVFVQFFRDRDSNAIAAAKVQCVPRVGETVALFDGMEVKNFTVTDVEHTLTDESGDYFREVDVMVCVYLIPRATKCSQG